MERTGPLRRKTEERFGRVFLSGVGVVLLVLALGSPTAAWAAFYGTYNGTNVTYSDVEDVNGLFGAPTVAGNDLGFSPSTFEADCSLSPSCPPAPAAATDTLTLEISTDPGYSISAFDIQFGGDFNFESVVGALGAATAVANLFVDILEVDGQSINVISAVQAADFEINGSGVIQQAGLTSTSAVEGYGTHTFTGSASVALGQILAANAVSGVVTRAIVSLDVSITAFAGSGATSRIEIKDTGEQVFGVTIIPEPTTAALLGLGLIGLASRRRSAI